MCCFFFITKMAMLVNNRCDILSAMTLTEQRYRVTKKYDDEEDGKNFDKDIISQIVLKK